MPIPLMAALPVAAVATVAGWRMLRRSAAPGVRMQAAEDALDALPEGVSLRKGDDSQNGALHIRRVLQWRGGAKYEFDLAAFGRIRLKRL